MNEEDLSSEEVTYTGQDLQAAIGTLDGCEYAEPDPADYGVWVPGIPVLVENGLTAANAPDWLSGLILDGIVAGVGAVLGFVPPMLVLFLLLAFLESCGYMARIAFVLDRVFRKFGLSGKSFIPILIGTGSVSYTHLRRSEPQARIRTAPLTLSFRSLLSPSLTTGNFPSPAEDTSTDWGRSRSTPCPTPPGQKWSSH